MKTFAQTRRNLLAPLTSGSLGLQLDPAGGQKAPSVRAACAQRAVNGHPEIETERGFGPLGWLSGPSACGQRAPRF
jgi:hypothetical protein